MITKKILLLAAFWLGAVSCRLVGSEIFIRPAAWYVDYDADGFDSEFAPAVAIGGVFAPSGRHEISLETAHLSWKWNAPFAPGSPFRTVGSGHLTAVVGNYRYYFQDSTARWRVFAGASAGATKLSGSNLSPLSGVVLAGNLDGWLSTFAGTFGISTRVAENISIELAYRYVHWGDEDYRTTFAGTGTSTNFIQSFPATRAHVATLGLSFRF
jgi:hypothetical protein